MDRIKEVFAHLWVVFVTIAVLDLSVTNLVPHRLEYGLLWIAVLGVFGTMALAGWLMHKPESCWDCWRASESQHWHWAVELYHRHGLTLFVAVSITAWILPQFWMLPQLLPFVIGQVVAIPLILFYGVVGHVHMSKCRGHWPAT